MNNEGYVYDFKIELVNSPKKHLLKILDNIEKNSKYTGEFVRVIFK